MRVSRDWNLDFGTALSWWCLIYTNYAKPQRGIWCFLHNLASHYVTLGCCSYVLHLYLVKWDITLDCKTNTISATKSRFNANMIFVTTGTTHHQTLLNEHLIQEGYQLIWTSFLCVLLHTFCKEMCIYLAFMYIIYGNHKGNKEQSKCIILFSYHGRTQGSSKLRQLLFTELDANYM